MYQFDSRIRYSEVGSDTKLRLISLLDYFQDCSTFHSEDLGLGIDYLKQNHLIWLMSYWQIDVLRFADVCQWVKIGTFPYDFKGCFGFRNFCMTDENGEMLAKANSMWTLMDTESMTPKRPPQEMIEAYVTEPRLEMEYLPRKLTFIGDAKKPEPVRVKKHHLDSNFHVNNGQYVAIACDFLPQDYTIGRMRASYHKSAVQGDLLYPWVYDMDDGIGITLCDKAGDPYAKVMFSPAR